MTIDPLVIIGAIGAMGALLLFIVRLFLTGAVHSQNMVPRADYEALRAINADYPEAIGLVAEAVKKLAASLEHVAVNGNEKARK